MRSATCTQEVTMKKRHFIPYSFCTGLLILAICVAAILSGCGGSAESSGVKREIPAPDEVSEEPQEAVAVQIPSLGQTKEEQIAGARKPTGGEKYKTASALMTEISEKINTMRDGAIDANNREHAESDSQHIAIAMPMLLYSMSPEIICATGFSEDEMANNGITEAAGYMGITDAKAVRNGMYDYTLTGNRFSDGQAFEVHCLCDPDTGGLRILEKVGGAVTEFLEFIPLGDNKYALQTSLERAYVTYRDGEFENLIYTRAVDSAKYNNEADSIYPTGSLSGSDWTEASGDGERDASQTSAGVQRPLSASACQGMPLFGARRLQGSVAAL